MSKPLEIISVDPAAGSEFSYTADSDMVIHSLVLSLTTSAVVGTRNVKLVADDGTNVFFAVGQTSTANQAANSTFLYSFFEGAAIIISAANAYCVAPLPAGGLRLRKGDRVRTLTGAFDVGDNFTAATLMVERF